MLMRNLAAKIALTPMMVIVAVVYVGCILWTFRTSFTSSRVLPTYDFVGWDQYAALFRSTRWIVSLENMFIFGAAYILGCLIVGYLMAIFIDQRVRGENTLRTIYLYPHAMSFIVTGLIWQWMLNPTLGLQDFVRNLGWESFSFNWIVDRDLAIFTVAIAGIWHGSGFVMALLLAGLRGIDAEIWKVSKIDGIPAWRMYIQVILPILLPMVLTCVFLLSAQAVKSFDIVVAMTNGGPGIATEVPAKYVMDYLFERSNIGRATAAATVMLVMVISIAAPLLYLRSFRKERQSGAGK